ncbi:MAG: hypothetical protein K6A44_04580 [bacterium]|nr:hypothetical protein [bacterium]
MKLSNILVLIFGFCLLFSTVTFARTRSGLDMSSPSVQLLKELNDEGKKLRQNDIPVSMPDVTADTSRAAQKKIEFENTKRVAFPSLYKVKAQKSKSKKNPDKE